MTRSHALHIIHIGMDSRAIIRRLEAAGWKIVRVKGTHHQFRHPDRPQRVTVQHPRKVVPMGSLESIGRQSGLQLIWEPPMTVYLALLRKDPDGDYGVDFPDFPGCITAGSTLEEARAMAEEALEFHIEGMVDEGLAIPEPSSLDVVMADPENADAIPFLVSVPHAPSRTVRVNVTIPEADLRVIDDFARNQGKSRSAFLTEAARRAIAAAPEHHAA